MYIILRELQAKEDINGNRVIKAKLSSRNGLNAEVTITVKAETKEDLKKVVPMLKKGAIFELKLEPLGKENTSLDDFQIFEEVQ